MGAIGNLTWYQSSGCMRFWVQVSPFAVVLCFYSVLFMFCSMYHVSFYVWMFVSPRVSQGCTWGRWKVWYTLLGLFLNSLSFWGHWWLNNYNSLPHNSNRVTLQYLRSHGDNSYIRGNHQLGFRIYEHKKGWPHT